MLPREFAGVAIRRVRRQIRDPRLSLRAIAKSSGLSSDAGGSAIGDRKDLVPGPAIDRCTNVRLFMNYPVTLFALAGDVRLATIRVASMSSVVPVRSPLRNRRREARFTRCGPTIARNPRRLRAGGTGGVT
jgi:hypothetical protein